MKKRLLSLLLVLAMVFSLMPAALAADKPSFQSFFESVPANAETEPGSPNSTNKWKVASLGGDYVLKSGGAGKSRARSTLQLTFTADAELTFEYKVSSEPNYDYFTITYDGAEKVKESGDLGWKTYTLSAESGKVLTLTYAQDGSGDKFDDCVYVRNFTAGKATVVTFHANGGVVVLDAAQSAPHCPIDVQKLDVDFLAFSGHKLMAPMGIGALYGKRALLDAMPPFLSGGEMIESVTRTGATYAQLPHKFEAGTVNAGGAVGLAAALDYLEQVGPDTVHTRELALTRQAMEGMQTIPGVHILGSDDPADHCGIVSFTVDGVHPHDIAAILDQDQVCIRAGHHCAQPLLAHLGVRSSARASLAFYNTEEDVARLLDSVKDLRRKMGYGA